jgi:hypothetical protein
MAKVIRWHNYVFLDHMTTRVVKSADEDYDPVKDSL